MKKTFISSLFYTFLLFFVPLGSELLSQNCNNGIQDGNEIDIDCGGLYCPPCGTDNTVRLNQVITQRRVLDLEHALSTTANIAVDADGIRFVLAYKGGGGLAENYIVTGDIETGETQQIYTWTEGGAAPFVDITRNGTRVMFTKGNDKIYVADWDGANRIEVADLLESQDPIFEDFEADIRQTPRFSFDGTSIYFMNIGNYDVTGLWSVPLINGALGQLELSLEDMTDVFNEDFDRFSLRDIMVSKSGEVFFLAAPNSLGLSELHIYYYENGSVHLLNDDIVKLRGLGISEDGSRVFYSHPDQAIAYVYDRALESRTDYDYTRLEAGRFLHFYPNAAGSVVLAETWSNVFTTTNGQTYLVFDINGRHFYPINTANYGISGNWDVFGGLMVMSQYGERLFFTRTDDTGTHSLWMVNLLAPAELGTEWPRISNVSFDQNWLQNRNDDNPMEIRLSALNGTQQISTVSVSEQSDLKGIENYMTGSSLGRYLYDDGTTGGDNVAGDNIWTETNFKERLAVDPIDFPERFTVRFNLFTPDRISSYNYGPLFITEEGISSVDNRFHSLNVFAYPSPTRDYIYLEIPREWRTVDFIDIYNEAGTIVNKFYHIELNGHTASLNVQNLPDGLYTMIIRSGLTEATARFVKL